MSPRTVLSPHVLVPIGAVVGICSIVFWCGVTWWQVQAVNAQNAVVLANQLETAKTLQELKGEVEIIKGEVEFLNSRKIGFVQ